jgi:hypothetical protein
MINQISTSSLTGSSYKADAGQTAAVKEKEKASVRETAAYILDIGGSDSEETKTHGLSADEIKALREQADVSASGLRDLVQKLIVGQQSNSPMVDITIQVLGNGSVSMTQAEAQEAIGENGDWGVNAVSDRIVDFAKQVSGGDTSKLQVLKDAIDRGFAGAKKTLGGKLPDISTQTYDAVMSKLDDWANSTETAVSE